MVVVVVVGVGVAALFVATRGGGDDEGAAAAPPAAGTALPARDTPSRALPRPRAAAVVAPPHAEPPAPYELSDIGPTSVAVNLEGGPATSYTMFTGDPPPRDRAITGIVTFSDGRPAHGAIVVADDRLTARGRELFGSAGATCDEDGSFELRVVANEGLAVVALHTTGGWSPAAVVPAGTDARDVRLRLDAPGAVTGVVTRAGDPEQAEVTAVNAGSSFTTTSGEDGRYRLASLPAGDYTLRVGLAQTIDGGSSRAVEAAVALRSAHTATVDVDLPAGTLLAVPLQYDEGDAPTVITYDLAAADPDAPQPRRNMLFGGADAVKLMQFHDVVPAAYELCVRAQSPGEPRRELTRCKRVEVTRDPPVQDVEIDLR
jgi:hypothetical protein